MKLLLLGVGCFLATLIGVEIVRRSALSIGVIDSPDERRAHAVPTPRGAGVAIILVTILSLFLFGDLDMHKAGPILLGGILLGILGLLDDLWDISISIRLLGQLVIVTLVVWFSGSYTDIWLPSSTNIWTLPGSVGLLLTVFFIVLSINVYNFMDGIDGLAGIQALIGGGIWITIGLLFGQGQFLVFGTVISAGSLAFLIRNWSPATIFLGDSGSTFFGYIFSAGPLIFLAGNSSLNNGIIVFVTVTSLWLFLADATISRFRLMLKGGRFWEPNRRHIYQLLSSKGMTARKICLLYGGLGSVLVMISVPLAAGWISSAFFLLPFAVIPMGLFYMVRNY